MKKQKESELRIKMAGFVFFRGARPSNSRQQVNLLSLVWGRTHTFAPGEEGDNLGCFACAKLTYRFEHAKLGRRRPGINFIEESPGDFR